MAALPEDQRLVLALVSVEGLSYREAAERLAVPIGTVMSRLARARRRLFDLLGEAPEEASAGPSPATCQRLTAMTRKLDDETLMAYADGALGPEEAAAVRAALAADPEAAADVDRFRESARLVRAAFDDTLAEPVPPTLERRVRAAARAAETERHALDALVRRRGRRPLALAASVALLLGLGIGSRLGHPAGDAALPGLGEALAGTASGVRASLPDGATLTPLATFRDRDGRWCRRVRARRGQPHAARASPAATPRAVAARLPGPGRHGGRPRATPRPARSPRSPTASPSGCAPATRSPTSRSAT